jgi:hypothetical protein
MHLNNRNPPMMSEIKAAPQMVMEMISAISSIYSSVKSCLPPILFLTYLFQWSLLTSFPLEVGGVWAGAVRDWIIGALLVDCVCVCEKARYPKSKNIMKLFIPNNNYNHFSLSRMKCFQICTTLAMNDNYCCFMNYNIN